MVVGSALSTIFLVTFLPFCVASAPEVAVATTTPQIATTTPKVWTFDTLVSHLSKKYGQDEAIARKIIECESQYKKGNTHENLRDDGTVWSVDWGYWQINDYWNLKEATRQGYDIRYNWQDNLEFGFKMLKAQGTSPWNASKYCWGKVV